MRKSAIIWFKQIDSAETSYKHFREINPQTGKRPPILGPDHRDAQIVYVIPEKPKDEEKYDPCKDKNLTLE
jgi:hypothetical protein